jgi:hypothetical protein
MKRPSGVLIRRESDGPSGARRPLRLEISRRRTDCDVRGLEHFVTQVALGDGEAVLMPRRLPQPAFDTIHTRSARF